MQVGQVRLKDAAQVVAQLSCQLALARALQDAEHVIEQGHVLEHFATLVELLELG